MIGARSPCCRRGPRVGIDAETTAPARTRGRRRAGRCARNRGRGCELPASIPSDERAIHAHASTQDGCGAGTPRVREPAARSHVPCGRQCKRRSGVGPAATVAAMSERPFARDARPAGNPSSAAGARHPSLRGELRHSRPGLHRLSSRASCRISRFDRDRPAYSGMNRHLRLGHGRIVATTQARQRALVPRILGRPGVVRGVSRRVSTGAPSEPPHLHHVRQLFDAHPGRPGSRQLRCQGCCRLGQGAPRHGHYFRRRHEQIVFASKGSGSSLVGSPDVWSVPRIHRAAYPTQNP